MPEPRSLEAQVARNSAEIDALRNSITDLSRRMDVHHADDDRRFEAMDLNASRRYEMVTTQLQKLELLMTMNTGVWSGRLGVLSVLLMIILSVASLIVTVWKG